MQITDYGKKIKIALILRGRSQQWLVRAVRKHTGRYFDAAYLQKLMTGAVATPGMLAAIDAILGVRADGSFQELFAWADAACAARSDEDAVHLGAGRNPDAFLRTDTPGPASPDAAPHVAQPCTASADAVSPHTAPAGPERPA